MPPLPNTLYTRDTTCWVYGGLTLNPLFWPARHDETLPMKAIYQFHPGLRRIDRVVGRSRAIGGMATIEGGDVLVPGNGVFIIGMSERTSRQAITQVAAKLFAEGAADRVVVAGMPKLRAAMHLGTVFTFADRGVVTIYPEIVDNVQTFTPLPSDQPPGVDVIEETKPFVEAAAAALGLPSLRVVETATPTPTRCCARRVSRSSPSSAPNWVVAGAAGTA
jgi:arginine deiminase